MKKLEQLVEQNLQEQRIYNSITHGNLTFKEVLFHMGAFMLDDPKSTYTVIIGTDSQVYKEGVDFVNAIVLLRDGSGGIYFWKKQRINRIFALQERMFHEASMSIELATQVMEEFKVEGMIRFNLEIHVDVGQTGKTREVINGVVGMVQGSGFKVKTKPQSVGATSVADRYT